MVQGKLVCVFREERYSEGQEIVGDGEGFWFTAACGLRVPGQILQV